MIKQIKYFQAVVRCNSFTDAAEECYISQSAISQQIQALEHELGVKLLNRANRRFTLTPAGEHFYQKSLVLLADYERLCRETIRIANQDRAELRIGYLKSYSGPEFRLAIGKFSEKYPDVSVQIMNGNHEELYDALRNGDVDVVLSDQRRAFSDEYRNLVLISSECYIELATRYPLEGQETIETDDLKNIPCILVVSPGQQENEKTYYREIVGIKGEFLFAENLEEARLLVIGGKGFIPIEGGENEPAFAKGLRRIRLTRRGKAIRRNYCVFWKTDNSGYYVEAFAGILKEQFFI